MIGKSFLAATILFLNTYLCFYCISFEEINTNVWSCKNEELTIVSPLFWERWAQLYMVVAEKRNEKEAGFSYLNINTVKVRSHKAFLMKIFLYETSSEDLKLFSSQFLKNWISLWKYFIVSFIWKFCSSVKS